MCLALDIADVTARGGIRVATKLAVNSPYRDELIEAAID
jgi:hypothetical protein